MCQGRGLKPRLDAVCLLPAAASSGAAEASLLAGSRLVISKVKVWG